jgi:hypothetical protein
MMMKKIVSGAVATLAVAISAAAFAGTPFSGELTLSKAVAAPSETQVDGITWRCEAEKCVGRTDSRSTLDSQMKECRKVVEALGEITSYRSRGRDMTKSSVVTCNRLGTSK